jgi:hypothetical protein
VAAQPPSDSSKAIVHNRSVNRSAFVRIRSNGSAEAAARVRPLRQ